MRPNQMKRMRECIEDQKQNVRDAHAQALWKIRSYKTKPAYDLLIAHLEGRIVELKIREGSLDSLLFTLSVMEDFDAYK